MFRNTTVFNVLLKICVKIEPVIFSACDMHKICLVSKVATSVSEEVANNARKVKRI